MSQVSKEEVVQSLRKQSRGAQKTSSQYRGVTKHQKGKWEARIGQMVGRKYKSVLLDVLSAPATHSLRMAYHIASVSCDPAWLACSSFVESDAA